MSFGPNRRELLAGAAAAATGLIRRVLPAAPDKDRDLAYRSAGDLVKALAGKKISSVELTDLAIARIEALDKPINAVVCRDFDRAREAAKSADAALGRGETRPLLGLPMTVKEAFNVAGLPTTWGNPRFAGWQPGLESLVVKRLKAAGAVILGKTNLPFMLRDWQSYNKIYGTTNNPWDLARTPGGSSGGAAAALALGFVALELGSDIGGSLRCPAHFCGVFAHKPSLDLIPLRGGGPPHVPDVPISGGLAVAGPMARSAADLALELNVLAGPDPEWEGKSYRLALPPPRHRKLADFRVLVIGEHPLCPTAASVHNALRALAEHLDKAGCRVERASPLLPDLALTTRVDVELLGAGGAANLPPDVRQGITAAANSLAVDDRSIRASRLRGLTMTHAEWIGKSRIRAGLRARWRALFGEVDVVLCPPMPTPAFPHDHSPLVAGQLDIDGREISYGDQIAWASLATVTDLPATVAPIGRTNEGLPIGVQIIGPYLEDRTTIAFAGMIEREFGGFAAPNAR